MIEKLRAHVEGLFEKAPKTKQAVEIKEEILQNTIDRYYDLIAEGKSEEAAYNISVAGIGDISSLLAGLMAPVSTSGYTKEEIAENRQRRALLLTVAIMLYILSVIPPIVCDEIGGNDAIGVSFMFLFIAAATGMIIYRSGISLHYPKNSDTVVEEFHEWKRQRNEKNTVYKSVTSAMWAFILVIYFVVSFATGAWYITWLTFIIGGACQNIIKAVFDLRS